MNFSNSQETRRALINVLEQAIAELKDKSFDTVNGTMFSMNRNIKIHSMEHQLAFTMNQLKRATIEGDTEQVSKAIGEIFKVADEQYSLKNQLPVAAE